MDQLLVQNQQLKLLLSFMVKLNQLLVKYRQQVQEMTANCTCRGCELTEPLEEQYQTVMEEAGQIEMTAFKELMILPISCSLNQKINEEQIVDVSFQNKDECSQRLGSDEINEPDDGEASRSNVKRILRKRQAKVDYGPKIVKQEDINLRKKKRICRLNKVEAKKKLVKDEKRKKTDKSMDDKDSDYQDDDVINEQKELIKKRKDLSEYKTNADGLFVGLDRPKFIRGQNTWLCDVPGCHFAGNRRKYLAHHKKVKHDGELIKCDECEKEFRSNSGLKEHKLSVHAEKKWRCQHPDCGKSFGNFKYFKIHQLRHTDFKPFACTWPGCNYRALYKGTIQVHLNSFHSDERPFTCTFVGCDKKFKTVYLMKDHKMRVHEGIVPKFNCSWPGCDNSYKAERTLIKHLLNHRGLKPMICNWPGCDFRTTTNNHLRKHIRYVHERIRKHPCVWPGCEKRFFDKDSLQEHVNTHTGHKPVKCLDPDCSWSFIQRGNMLKHYRNIHEKKTKS